MPSALLRMLFIVARCAERSAVPDVIPKLRKSVCVLNMMCHRGLRPAAIPGTFLTQIPGFPENALAPDLVPVQVVIHI